MNKIVFGVLLSAFSSCAIFNLTDGPGLLNLYSFNIEVDSLMLKTDEYVESTTTITRTFNKMNDGYARGKYREYTMSCENDSMLVSIMFIDSDSISKIGLSFLKMRNVPFQTRMERKLRKENQALYDTCETCFVNGLIEPLRIKTP
ncbi:hypothetical protein JYT74_02990 [Crocinitomix catalasitica]|nr:hypothetical protein [Crocinitomix catalasitica]